MRANWRLAALPLALTALSAALVFATQCSVGQHDRMESEDGRGPSRGAAAEDPPANGEISGGASMDGLAAVLAPPVPEGVRASSLGGFLDDLHAWQTEASCADEAPCMSVEFEGRASLPSLAGDVLEAYARTRSASLVASGYLDLKGNVWGAVLRGGTTWCDVLLVTTEDDALSRVRVTRVLPGR